MSRRVSVRDVARVAGASISSVSRVLNGSGYASASLRERVARAIEETAYSPSYVARHLRTGRSRAVGFMVSCETGRPAVPRVEHAAAHRHRARNAAFIAPRSLAARDFATTGSARVDDVRCGVARRARRALRSPPMPAQRFLSRTFLHVMSRVMGLLLAAVAIEFMIGGLKEVWPR